MSDGQFTILTGLISALITALIFVVREGIKAQNEERKKAAEREERHVTIIQQFGKSYEGMADSMKDMAQAADKQAHAMDNQSQSLKELVDLVRKDKA